MYLYMYYKNSLASLHVFTEVLMEYIEFLLQVRIKLSEPSVKVKEDWRVIEEIDFSTF